jgi:hypothetical protein
VFCGVLAGVIAAELLFRFGGQSRLQPFYRFFPVGELLDLKRHYCRNVSEERKLVGFG